MEPIPRTTSQYKKKPAKVSRKKLNSDPVNTVIKCSSNVSVRASPNLEQVVDDGGSSRDVSVRTRETSDETGNTTALTEMVHVTGFPRSRCLP